MRTHLKASILALSLLCAGVLVSPSAQVQIQRGVSTLATLANPTYFSGPNAAGGTTQTGRLESHDYGSGVTQNNIVLGAGATGSPNIRLQVDSTAAHIGFNIGGTNSSAVTAMIDGSSHGLIQIRSASSQSSLNYTTGPYSEFLQDNDTLTYTQSGERRYRIVPYANGGMVFDAPTASAGWGAVTIIGDADSTARLAFGLDSGTPFLGLGPGNASRDTFLHRDTAGTFLIDSAYRLAPTLFASLGAPTNGTVRYCSDCTKATPCASGGTGAIAKRLNGAWDCD